MLRVTPRKIELGMCQKVRDCLFGDSGHDADIVAQHRHADNSAVNSIPGQLRYRKNNYSYLCSELKARCADHCALLRSRGLIASA